MNSNFGRMGDVFPVSEVKCKVRGCRNHVVISGDANMRQKVQADGRREGLMCQSCLDKFHSLHDLEQPCATPGCTGTWVWTRYQQVEAEVNGHDTPPKGYCKECRDKMNQGEDKQIPCRIKKCPNTWTWTKRMQFESKDGKPPYRLCDECFEKLRTLEDKEIPCRVKSCTNTWTWTAMMQVEHWRNGLPLDKPPVRMCADCLAKFKEHNFVPKEMPCKIKGCNKTWTYSAFEQMDNLVACKEGETPQEPSRMCKDCYSFYLQAKDKEEECCNRGCSNKWIWTRSQQLTAKVRGLDQPPHYRMCDECTAKLKELKDIEEPCAVKGCTGVYVYKAIDQLKDQLRGHRSGIRRCKACNEFIASHEPQKIVCEKCGREFDWSVLEQLYTSLGQLEKPTTCAECNSKEISAILPDIPQPVRPEKKGLEVHPPTGGPWNGNAVIRDWPAGMDRAAIAKMEKAAVRVVCIGDSMTSKPANAEVWWTEALEEQLNSERTANSEDGAVAVLNAGIPNCTTELGALRFERDVAPFEPHWIVFSFAFADACLKPLPHEPQALQERLDAVAAAFAQFVEKASQLPEKPRLLCWKPNPIYPQTEGFADGWRENAAADETLAKTYEAVLRYLEKLARQYEIPIVDAHALFLCSGARSAQTWMKNWYQPTDEGARLIANWLMAEMRKPRQE